MIKRLFVVVSILFTVMATAQEGSSSPYSYYGIGLNTFKGTVENRTMGGLNIFSDSIHMNLGNPASYGKLGLTTYTVGGTHSSIDVKSETATEKASVTTFDYLAVGIPTGKIGVGFGLIPYTSVGYNLINRDDATGVSTQFTGSGGLNNVFLSAGYSINENFSVGIGAKYGFGNIENKSLFLRDGLQLASREINESRLSGFSYTFAVDYQQMLSDKLEFRASGIFSPEAELNSENFRQVATVGIGANGREVVGDFINIDVADSDLTLPSEFTLGAGIGQPRKWFLGVEYTGVGASSYNNRSFNPEGAVFTEASKYKVGGFFIPNYSSLTSYFSRLVYRAGFRMEESGLELDGEAINEFGISFGVGLPVGTMFSNANLGFEYGQRGTTNSGLIQEDFVNISISLSLNGRWFVKSKFN